jgi:hypothetical protein
MLEQNGVFSTQFYIGYVDRHRAIQPISGAFPADTDYSWREFFAGFFFVFI